MKCKEIRAAQLEDLKNGVMPGLFCVEILNGAFQPWKVFKFETREEAEKKYAELETIYCGGFLRKYAIFGI